MQTLICLQLCQVSDQLYHMLATKIRIPALQKPWWCLLQVTAYLDGFHATFRNLKAVKSEHPDWVSIFTDFLDYLKEEENKEDQI